MKKPTQTSPEKLSLALLFILAGVAILLILLVVLLFSGVKTS